MAIALAHEQNRLAGLLQMPGEQATGESGPDDQVWLC